MYCKIKIKTRVKDIIQTNSYYWVIWIFRNKKKYLVVSFSHETLNQMFRFGFYDLISSHVSLKFCTIGYTVGTTEEAIWFDILIDMRGIWMKRKNFIWTERRLNFFVKAVITSLYSTGIILYGLRLLYDYYKTYKNVFLLKEKFLKKKF